MSTQRKPRFHDEECFGSTLNYGAQSAASNIDVTDIVSSSEKIKTAQKHYENQNVNTAINDLIAAYETIERDSARLAALRNQILKDLSNSTGWQSRPNPEAMRLRRATSSIPLIKKRK